MGRGAFGFRGAGQLHFDPVDFSLETLRFSSGLIRARSIIDLLPYGLERLPVGDDPGSRYAQFPVEPGKLGHLGIAILFLERQLSAQLAQPIGRLKVKGIAIPSLLGGGQSLFFDRYRGVAIEQIAEILEQRLLPFSDVLLAAADFGATGLGTMACGVGGRACGGVCRGRV
jgi:hypothetical protein